MEYDLYRMVQIMTEYEGAWTVRELHEELQVPVNYVFQVLETACILGLLEVAIGSPRNLYTLKKHDVSKAS